MKKQWRARIHGTAYKIKGIHGSAGKKILQELNLVYKEIDDTNS